MTAKFSIETNVHKHGNIAEQVTKLIQTKKNLWPVLDIICIQAVATHIQEIGTLLSPGSKLIVLLGVGGYSLVIVIISSRILVV